MRTEEHVRAAFRSHDRQTLASRVLHSGQVVAETQEDNLLLRFDDGQSLSLAEAAHGGVLVIGGPGRGKTSGIITPAAQRLIEGGYAGLVMDVKNTFTPALRKLAASAGRQDDIIEIGSHPTATPVNVLSGLDADALDRALHDFIAGRLQHTQNFDWTLKGVRLCCDCARVLLLLAREDPRFAPSFALLDRMTSDYGFARKVFLRYREGAYDSADPAQAALVARVENEAFHLLNKRTEGYGKRETEWDMQLTWMLHAVRDVLGPLCASPVLMRNLSAPAGPELDFGRLVFQEGRILVLRFSCDCTAAGNLVARSLKERFYAAAYRRFDKAGADDRKVFCVMDEFQDILTLEDSSALDDFSWVSKSREFGVVNLMATQSLSSLRKHRGRQAQADALVSICSAKLVLQSDDPALDAYMRSVFEMERPVAKLGRAEAALIKFALPERRQEVAHVGFQHMHDATAALLEILPEPEAFTPDKAGDVGRLLADLAREAARPRKLVGPWEPLYKEYPEIVPEDPVMIFPPPAFLDAVRRLCAEIRRLLPGRRLLGLSFLNGELRPKFDEPVDDDTMRLLNKFTADLLREYCAGCGRHGETRVPETAWGPAKNLCPECAAKEQEKRARLEENQRKSAWREVQDELAKASKAKQRERKRRLAEFAGFRATVADDDLLGGVPTEYLPALLRALETLDAVGRLEGVQVQAAYLHHGLLKVVAEGGRPGAAKDLDHAARSNSGGICRLCGEQKPRIRRRVVGGRVVRVCRDCAARSSPEKLESR
jgi:ribosome-binding protein aMBF1 (putative translation factor)